MSENSDRVPLEYRKDTEIQAQDSMNRVERLKGDPIGEGGNSRAYSVKERPDLILLQVVTEFFERTPENLNARLAAGNAVKDRMNQLPDDVQVGRIVEAFTENGEYYELQERAAGEPLHGLNEESKEWLTRLQLLADAPLDQYKKMIQDLRAITAVGLEVDPSKPDNIFYDSKVGFTYIDLAVPTGDAVAYSPFTQLVYGYSRNATFTEEANAAIRTIIDKLREAGDTPEDLGGSFDAVQTWMKRKKGTPEEIVASTSTVANDDDVW